MPSCQEALVQLRYVDLLMDDGLEDYYYLYSNNDLLSSMKDFHPCPIKVIRIRICDLNHMGIALPV